MDCVDCVEFVFGSCPYVVKCLILTMINTCSGLLNQGLFEMPCKHYGTVLISVESSVHTFSERTASPGPCLSFVRTVLQCTSYVNI